MKNIHKGLVGERVLSEGYIARLASSTKDWAPNWQSRLQDAINELANSTNELFVHINGDADMNLDKAVEMNKVYDDVLRNYRKGVVAQVAAMMSGPA